MGIKDYLNSKGLSVDFTIYTGGRRSNEMITIKVADLLEEYHKLKIQGSLEELSIADLSALHSYLRESYTSNPIDTEVQLKQVELCMKEKVKRIFKK